MKYVKKKVMQRQKMLMYRKTHKYQFSLFFSFLENQDNDSFLLDIDIYLPTCYIYQFSGTMSMLHQALLGEFLPSFQPQVLIRRSTLSCNSCSLTTTTIKVQLLTTVVQNTHTYTQTAIYLKLLIPSPLFTLPF